MKKLTSILLVLAMSIMCICTFAGCDVSENNSNEDDTVIAKVGDTEIYLHEFRATYDMYVEYYANYGYDITTDEASLAEFKQNLLERIIAEKAVLIKVSEEGIDKLSEEQQAELDEAIEAEYTSIEEYYRPLAEEQAESSAPEDIQAKYEELVAAESKNYTGTEMTYEEYLEYVEESITNNYLITLYKDELVYKDITVSDDEITAKYDELIASDTEAYTEAPEAYKNDQESAELLEEMPTAYTPEGYSRILSILIVPKGETSDTYTNNEDKMEKLQAEYGELAFEDAISGSKTNQARLAEIIKEYNELKTANDTEYTTANESYRQKIDEAYAALESGKSFVEVMKEYTEDPDFDEDSIFNDIGILISTKYSSSSDLSDEVKAEFAKLKKGEYSRVFEDEDGYHIIYYLADEPSGVRDISQLKTFIEDELLAEEQTNEWDALVKEWVADTSFVTIEQEVLDSVK
ncbi:MAG: SurA N-terminal domain-containing protein [Clostridia bacterium]|nr:SurA N-terminal domain-containing protein [Clostridia bacterium]